MSAPSIELNLARRPSLAESIEITVEEHTAHTILPASHSPFNLGSYQFPSSSTSVYPAPNKYLASPPAVPEPLPFMGRRASLAESIEVTIEQATTSSYAPPYGSGTRVQAPSPADEPPAYRFPDVAAPALLSFYPSGGTTKPKPHSSPVLSPSARLAPPPTFIPPPSYAPLPRTSAERLFYLGFVFPPLWLAGAWRIWHSAIPSHLRPHDHKRLLRDGLEPERDVGTEGEGEWWAAVGLGLEGVEERGPRVEEVVRAWREEELVWARRCGQFFGGAVVMGVMVATVVGSVFR